MDAVDAGYSSTFPSLPAANPLPGTSQCLNKRRNTSNIWLSNTNLGLRHCLCIRIKNNTLFQRNPAKGLILLAKQTARKDGGWERKESCIRIERRGGHDDELASTASHSRSREDCFPGPRTPAISKRKLFEFLSENRLSSVELIFSSHVC